MATIKVGINVSDNGTTKKATDAAERLKSAYDSAAKSAKSIGAAATMSSAASRAATTPEIVAYNRQRSVGAGTGASARDFAKQSEGLGGLVRLYATFAANVFAVSSAFNALSTAMDTTNMIRGLDQLGASSGVALGSLSKRLVAATDGAVSLREAMEATVKAASSGIDSTSILRLGKVAQQASVALGVNASDALNRLSRGVIKLEPELLDELGIFTKIDPAVKAYAKSVNKAVSELTDFERRQAFLNAVIEEGEKKFSQIEINTNPYTKLSATLKDVLQNTLELINKGLTPLANFLSESPGVLTAGLTAIGAVLLKQALPAIGQVRENLRRTAEEATDVASGKAGEALAARKRLDALNLSQIEDRIEKEIDAVDAAQKKIQSIEKDSINKRSSVYRLLNKELTQITALDIERAERRVQRLSKDPALAEEAEASKQVVEGIKNQIAAEKDYKAARQKAAADLEKDKNSWSVFGLVQKTALDYEVKAKRDAIVSNAAYNASLIGITGSWRLMKIEIEQSGLAMTRLQRATLLVRGAMAAAAGAASTLVNVLGKIFFILGLLTTAWSLIGGLFSTKELSNFNSEIDNLNASTENLGKTFAKTAADNPFSEQSLKARSSALIEFSQSINNSAVAANRALSSLQDSTLANFADKFVSFFNIGGIEKDFAQSLTTSVRLALQEISDPALQKKAQEQIGKALGLSADSANTEELFIKLGEVELRSPAVARLVKIFKDVGTEAGNSASRIEEVRTALDKTRTSFNSLQESYKIKNPIIEYAETGLKALNKLDDAVKKARTPQEAQEAVRQAVDIQDTVPIFGSIKKEDLEKRLPEFNKFVQEAVGNLGANARITREQLIDSLGKAFGSETAGLITGRIKYFNDLIRNQLKIEEEKNKNAYKEFAFSLAPELNVEQINLEIEKAQSKLRKVTQEFELARTGPTPLTEAQVAGFETQIAGAKAESQILNAKKVLEALKQQGIAQEKTQEIVRNTLKINKEKLELEFLSGQITEEAYITYQKVTEETALQIKLEQEKQKIQNDTAVYNKIIDLQEGISTKRKEELKNAFALLQNSKIQAAESERVLGIKNIEVNTTLKLNDLQSRNIAQLQQVRALEYEIYTIRNNSVLNLAEKELTNLEKQNKLSRNELVNRSSQIASQKIAQDFTDKRTALALSFTETQSSLEKEIADARTKGNEREAAALQQRLEQQRSIFVERAKELGSFAEELALEDQQLSNNNLRLDLIEKEASIRRQIEDSIRSAADREQDYNTLVLETRLNGLQEIGALDQESLIKAKQLVDVRKIDLDIQRKQRSIVLDSARQIEDLETRITRGGLSTEEVAALRAQQDQIRSSLASGLDLLQSEYQFRQAILEQTSGIALQEAKRLKNVKDLTEQYSKIVEIGKLLEDSFGGFLDKFGKVLSGLGQALQSDLDSRTKLEEEYNKKKIQAAEKYKNNEQAQRKEFLKLEQEENTKAAILNNELLIKSSRSFKAFFKEKTGAYKTLTLIEKVAAAETIALNLQVMASNLATLPGKIASGVSQLVGQGGFAGLVAAGGFLALMASLGFKKGSAKVTPSISVEESRRTQTTGQFYSGNTLMTRAGALQADPTETLNSIDESLEIIKSSGFDDLAVFNKMSKSLDKIDLNTKALSERLAISFGSIFSGLQGGVTNNNALANFAGKPLVKAGATVGGAALGYLGGITLAPILANAFVSAFGSTAVTSIIGTSVASSVAGGIASSLGVLGGPVGLVLGALLGKNLDKIITSIFGGKKTTTVRDFGITVEGTVNKIAEANADLVKGFAELDVKVSGGWFSRNKYFVETITKELDPQQNKPIFEYIGVLFSDIRNSLLTSAEVLGTNIDSVLETAVIEPLRISTKDLKPEEIANAIKNQTSAAFNQIAAQAFGPLIEALRQPLEEAGTTLTRLTAQTQAFSDGMLLLGKNVQAVTGTLKTIIADDLVKAFGNLENYQNKVQFFRENFLTEAEQIAPVSQKLTEELNKLGVSTSLTRDQYKSLVLQQDLTKTSGRETFVALLNLAEGFDKVTEFAEKAQEKLSGFSKTIRDFIKEQTLQIAGSTNGLNFLLKEFQSTVTKSLQGDEKSLNYLTEIAGKTIESARSSARTTREFNLLRAGVVSSLAQVATEIETGNIKLLTPQEQTNVILEQIEQNTSSLPEDIAQKLANQIDGILNPVVADTSTAATTTLPDAGVVVDTVLGEGQGGPTSSGPVSAGTLALANAINSTLNSLAETIKGNPLLGLVPGAGMVVLANEAAKDVIAQATVEAAEAAIIAISGPGPDPDAGVSAGAIADAAAAGGLDAFGGKDPFAKGGAFQKGVQMFESGAAFSNSVVNNPTLFPMGVMGEAGPEAIMPLTRMNDGSLGVTADIPFNNNSQSNQQLIQEVRELKKEMEKVRIGVEVTATGTNKTFRLLDRVTENGDALNVLAVEGSVTTLSSIQGGQF